MTDHKSMPKVELHLHIEGAAPPDFIRQMAAEKGTDLSGIFNADGSYKWVDFAGFLKVYEAASSVLQSPEDFKRLTQAVLTEQAAHGVIYTEHFLAPDLCGDGSATAWGEYLAAMIEGADDARRTHNIDARFIPTCIRHFGPEKAERCAKISAATKGPMVTGFGMGGEERHLMPADFARAFAIAEEAGLGLTCHAGEIEGAHMIDATLDAMNVTRIGHGVRAIESPDTIARLIDRDITLEVNPGSNISLSVFPDWPDHPITKLQDAGVKVTISTDDPPYFHTDMTHEYAMLAKTHQWDAARLAAQNITAMEAAFCDAPTRAAIIDRLTSA